MIKIFEDVRGKIAKLGANFKIRNIFNKTHITIIDTILKSIYRILTTHELFTATKKLLKRWPHH